MRAFSPETKSRLTDALRLSLRAALSAGLAVGLANLLGLEYPLHAMIGAVLVTDLSPARTRQMGLQRLAGTVLGATLGAALSGLLPAGTVAVGLGILTAMLASHLAHLPGAAKLAGYVCGVVLLDHHDNPWSYAFYRLLETALGIGAAGLVSLVPKLIDEPVGGRVDP
jgi:uncharacterized membrane protein YgaE (UPF0421/DUF939 family)